MSEKRIAAESDAGSRADVFVSLHFDLTRTAAARPLAEGAVKAGADLLKVEG